MAGLFDGQKLDLREMHRFPNGPVDIGGSYHWEIDRLFAEVKRGIAKGCETFGSQVVSVGVDTWGIDYGLFDADGQLLNAPFAYRDDRTEGMEEEACRRAPRQSIYEATGIQFLFLNTLNQLLSEVVQDRPQLKQADRLLFIPDMINYWLTGKMLNERTFASTSQMLNPRTGTWAMDLLEKIGIPTRILGELVEAGTPLGGLKPELRQELGTGDVQVVAVGAHDTASAVAAVPAETENYAYLSSGTWSLMGIESPEPIINDRSYTYGFTNEGGVCDTIRVLKNICGLWLIQECKRNWEEQGENLSYAEITSMAKDAPQFVALIDPDWEGFSKPCDMPAQVRAFCEKTGQTPPETKASIARTILESLALRYRSVMEMLEDLVEHRIDVLHVVGGGCQNFVLNQFTADAIGRSVIAGPVEATSLGNVLMQMVAAGALKSLAEGRKLIRASFGTKTYEPEQSEAWDKAYVRYKEIEGKL
jgi:sugar (pentulose or hexulose) kinase